MIEVENGHRLVIPAPEGGWLAPRVPLGRDDRRALAEEWRTAARRCAGVAGLPTLGPVRLLAIVRLGSYEERGIRHPEDVRLVVGAARQGLVAAGVLGDRGRNSVIREELRIGQTDDLGGHLILHMVEVRGDE